MRAVVLADYRSQYPDPIAFARGAVVRLGERDDEWPAFAWTTLHDGRAGWAPLRWLRPLGDGRAQALRDYDARELDVAAGQDLRLIDEHGGWWWAQRDDGAQGWVPARHLQTIAEGA
ncbi:SH3 domain-containing protein [Lysobacter enzymogenes]|uniref:SH3 domain protein n=1 Tax=Lysobacter enzymogenes TaxID=69 RepID=A0A0S2DLS4_LYSEN|nr:SH3 domain-containing protein [Lysobacter enzymogenes]ALN59659.1 SH3 domain protein [Lysobacter enzymogenes]QCW27775.1 peptide-binding protein [Lysobacter enzymogenes]QQQ02294.1 peptide-binding protein [Lysobacter enzymogenes]